MPLFSPISLPSPNYNARPAGCAPSVLVLHYTGMRTAEEALARLRDPESQVSAHYVVGEDGAVWSLIPEECRAWHAGVSRWRGRDNVNDISLGVELVNPGHEFGYRPFPAPQMEALAALGRDILSRHAIPPRNIVGHSDIAPTRKQDPGELLDWAWLAAQGVGLWPVPKSEVRKQKAEAVQEALREYGYGIEITGAWDAQTRGIITAFQRHFRPHDLSGDWDAECAALLEGLLFAA
jgi:N-acetylmuramoyl-L-alanine amidase